MCHALIIEGGDHNGSIIGARDGDGDGLIATDSAVVIRGVVGEEDLATFINGEIIKVSARIEGIGAVGIEGQRTRATSDVVNECVAGDGAVDIGSSWNVAAEDSVFSGGFAVVRGAGVVIGARDGDGDRFCVTDAAISISGVVCEGDITSLINGEVIEVSAWSKDVGTVCGIEGQRTAGNIGGECIAVDASIDVSGSGDTASEVIIFSGSFAVVSDNGSIIGARDGDGDGLIATDSAVVIRGVVGEEDLATFINGEIIKVSARIEGIGAVGIEGQRTRATSDVVNECVAGDGAVDIGSSWNVAAEDSVFSGGFAVISSHWSVIHWRDIDSYRSSAASTKPVGDGVTECF